MDTSRADAGGDAPDSGGRDAMTADARVTSADAGGGPDARAADRGVDAASDGGAASTSMSFFVSSVGSGAGGGNFGGLAGADTRCQALATAAGAGHRTWRAYLSALVDRRGVPVHARDRIGRGPWLNQRGQLVGADATSLHANGIPPQLILDEKGMPVPREERGIATGSTKDGMAYILRNCKGWTSSADGVAEGEFARLGHGDATGASWNDTQGATCSADALRRSLSSGRVYCFAAD